MGIKVWRKARWHHEIKIKGEGWRVIQGVEIQYRNDLWIQVSTLHRFVKTSDDWWMETGKRLHILVPES